MNSRIRYVAACALAVSLLWTGSAAGASPPTEGEKGRPEQSQREAAKQRGRDAVALAPKVAAATKLERTGTPNKDDIREALTIEYNETMSETYADFDEEQRAEMFGDSEELVTEDQLDFWVLPTEDPDDRAVGVVEAGLPVSADGAVGSSDFEDLGVSWNGNYGQPHPENGQAYYTDTSTSFEGCYKTDATLTWYRDARRLIESWSPDYIALYTRSIFDITGGSQLCDDYIDYGYHKIYSNEASARWQDWSPWEDSTGNCRSYQLGANVGAFSMTQTVNDRCDTWDIPEGLSISSQAGYSNSYFVKYDGGSPDDDYRSTESLAYLKVNAGKDSARQYVFYMDPDNDPCSYPFCD